jgi:hypothetical protein
MAVLYRQRIAHATGAAPIPAITSPFPSVDGGSLHPFGAARVNAAAKWIVAEEGAMQGGVNKDGFVPVDWAEEEREEGLADEVSISAADLARERALEEMESLRRQIALLRIRASEVAEQSGDVVRAKVHWADASARAQLGEYPWIKLAGAFVGTFLAARLLRHLPLGLLVTALAARSNQGARR